MILPHNISMPDYIVHFWYTSPDMMRSVAQSALLSDQQKGQRPTRFVVSRIPSVAVETRMLARQSRLRHGIFVPLATYFTLGDNDAVSLATSLIILTIASK